METSESTLLTDVRPIYGIAWNRAVVNSPTTDRVNKAIARLRNSYFPENGHLRLAAMLKGAFSSAESPPSELRGWRMKYGRFRLELTLGWGAILETVAFLNTKGVFHPAGVG